MLPASCDALQRMADGTHDVELERPHPSRPDLDCLARHAACALLAIRYFELDAVPPAFPRRLAPEEEQLLRCDHLGLVERHLGLTWLRAGMVDDASLEEDERNRRDGAASRLEVAVAPGVVAVEATVGVVDRKEWPGVSLTFSSKTIG